MGILQGRTLLSLRSDRFCELMRALADYYTGQVFANLLVSGLKIEGPKMALDLVAGQGALLSEVCRRWPTARLHAAEVDSNGWPVLRQRFPGLRFSVAMDSLVNCRVTYDWKAGRST